MLVLGSLLCAVAFVALFRVPLKKVPWLFYAIGIALDVLVICSTKMDLPTWVRQYVVMPNFRGMFAFWLFTIVMFMGTLPRGSEIRRKLIPIRAEISIFAAIIIVGHCVSLWRAMTMSTMSSKGYMTSFVIAITMAVLLAILTVTSFYFMKRAMGGKVWKAVQRLSYPFFVLTYAHIGLAIFAGATHGGVDQIVGIIVYGGVVIAYVFFRIRRYQVDKAARAEAKAKHVEFEDDTLAVLK